MGLWAGFKVSNPILGRVLRVKTYTNVVPSSAQQHKFLNEGQYIAHMFIIPAMGQARRSPWHACGHAQVQVHLCNVCGFECVQGRVGASTWVCACTRACSRASDIKTLITCCLRVDHNAMVQTKQKTKLHPCIWSYRYSTQGARQAERSVGQSRAGNGRMHPNLSIVKGQSHCTR